LEQRFAGLAANTKARVVIQHAPEDFAAMPVFPKYLNFRTGSLE
jgi:N-acyl homoserine lactone hydrolase